MKRKRKEKLRKQKVKRDTSLPWSSKLQHLEQAKNYPIYECLINPSWETSGLANIIISRRMPTGRFIVGAYLVDILCLGLKDTFFEVNMPLSDYITKVRSKKLGPYGLVDCPIPLAHEIIYGAIDYALNIGFEPHKDFEFTKKVLEDREKITDAPKVEFGKNGKPFFVAGPHDDVDAIIEKLESRLGAGNFNFMIRIDQL